MADVADTTVDPRVRLRALWSLLEARGATVPQVDLGALTDVEVAGQIEHEARRLRAMNEAGLSRG